MKQNNHTISQCQDCMNFAYSKDMFSLDYHARCNDCWFACNIQLPIALMHYPWLKWLQLKAYRKEQAFDEMLQRLRCYWQCKCETDCITLQDWRKHISQYHSVSILVCNPSKSIGYHFEQMTSRRNE